MEKSGIEYDEKGLPTATNGSWEQTTSYLINQLINHLTSSGNTSITITQEKKNDIRYIFEVVSPLIKYSKPTIRFEQKTITPVQVNKVNNLQLHRRCCKEGDNDCKNKVDKCVAFWKKQNGGYIELHTFTNKYVNMKDCGLSVYDKMLEVDRKPKHKVRFYH